MTAPAPRPMLTVGPETITPTLSLIRVMGWLLLISSILSPRVVILAFWIFGSTLGNAFSSSALPILGFFLLPWTTMVYALVWGVSSDSVTGAQWIFVGLAVLADLATWAGLHRLVSHKPVQRTSPQKIVFVP